MKRYLAVFTLAFLFTSCASNPQLYPNQHYQRVGKDVAKRDIQACKDSADEFVESGKGKAIATSAGTGAVVGGAVGGVAGIFGKNILGGAAVGAAVGGAGGAAHGAVKPDEMKRRYVNKCLQEKGYEVLGWD